jgi:hypothetical protein
MSLSREGGWLPCLIRNLPKRVMTDQIKEDIVALERLLAEARTKTFNSVDIAVEAIRAIPAIERAIVALKTQGNPPKITFAEMEQVKHDWADEKYPGSLTDAFCFFLTNKGLMEPDETGYFSSLREDGCPPA